MLLARIAIWLFAVFVAVFPLGFMLGSEKGISITRLLLASEYNGLKRDLCFVAIAILALGCVDTGEAIIVFIDRSNKLRCSLMIAMFLFIIAEFILFSAISGHAKSSDPVDQQTFNMFLSTFVCAAVSRTTLLLAS